MLTARPIELRQIYVKHWLEMRSRFTTANEIVWWKMFEAKIMVIVRLTNLSLFTRPLEWAKVECEYNKSTVNTRLLYDGKVHHVAFLSIITTFTTKMYMTLTRPWYWDKVKCKHANLKLRYDENIIAIVMFVPSVAIYEIGAMKMYMTLT